LSGFTAGTQYDIRVKATNPAGTGPLSVSTLLTYYTKPTAPAITAVALDPAAAPTGVNVTFTAPANTGGGIINYVVSAFNGATLTATVNGSASPLKLTSLTAGINYTFSVVAVNPGGSTSSVTSNLTYYTQPSVPRTVTATVGHDIGSGKASLTWVEPSDKGGGTMEYQLIARTTSGGTVAYTSAWITTFSNIATGLTDGTSYTFTVYARNTTVTTLINSATATATPYDLPPIPTGLTATSGSNGSVPLTWSVPSSTPAVDKYLITMTNNTTGVSTTNTSTTNSYTWSGLTNGTTYSFKVAASNNNGANYSDPSSSVSATPYTTPSAPSLSVSLGELVANLSWSVPADNGSAIQYYRVSKDGTTWSANIAATTTTYTFTTVASTNYTFYVQAYNAAGWGSSGTNSQSIPAPPAAISITHVYAGINNTVVSGVSVAWTGGSGYTSMELHGWSTFSDSYAGGGAVYGNPTNTVGIEGWDVYVWLIAINAGGRTVSGIEWA
jgi:titin